MVGLVAGHKSPYASSEVIKVERHAIYNIDDGESWRQGASVLALDIGRWTHARGRRCPALCWRPLRNGLARSVH